MTEQELKEISSLCEEGIGLNECTLALKVPTLIAEIRRLNKRIEDLTEENKEAEIFYGPNNFNPGIGRD